MPYYESVCDLYRFCRDISIPDINRELDKVEADMIGYEVTKSYMANKSLTFNNEKLAADEKAIRLLNKRKKELNYIITRYN